MRYIVRKDWAGETCLILAGGPSLRGINMKEQLEGIKPRPRVIAINDSWQLAPWADVCYFGDYTWWQMQQAMNPRSQDGSMTSFHDMIYKGNWITIANFSEHPQIKCIWSTGQEGLETNPAAVRTGSNSGYAAINLAYHFGVKRIILMGYDMKCKGQRTHWHNAPREGAGTFSVLLNTFLCHFDSLVEPLEKAKVEVINANPDSALRCWLCLPLEEAMRRVRESYQEAHQQWDTAKASR